MKSALVGVVVSLALGLGGCKTMHTGSTFSEYDDFDKLGKMGVVIGGLGSSFSHVQITGSSFVRIKQGGGLAMYAYQATVMHRGVALTARSAAFEANGQVFNASVSELASTYEFTRFNMPLTQSQIASLANAEEIRFRLYTSKGKTDAYEFKASQVKATKQFYNEYVLGRPDAE